MVVACALLAALGSSRRGRAFLCFGALAGAWAGVWFASGVSFLGLRVVCALGAMTFGGVMRPPHLWPCEPSVPSCPSATNICSLFYALTSHTSPRTFGTAQSGHAPVVCPSATNILNPKPASGVLDFHTPLHLFTHNSTLRCRIHKRIEDFES